MAGRFSVEAVFKAIDRITAPVRGMQNSVGKFTRKMEKGLRSVNRMARKVGGGLKRLAKVGIGGVAIAATLAAVAIKKMADSADALAKLSRRLKFPIEELQEWRFVAEQSGLSSAEFDKSLEKFTKTVGEARAGTGTLVTILKKSNPELLKQITSAKDVSSAFDLYVKGLRGTENQLDKTALATAAFGRQGGKFLNITEQSAAAIRKLRAEQRENGVITKQQAEAAEAWNDALNSLKRSIVGFRDQVIAPLLPILTGYAKRVRAILIANRELISQKVAGFFKFISENATTILKVAKGVGIAIAAFVVLTTILKTFILVMTAVNIVMALNPVGLIVLAIGALVVAIAAAVIWWDKIEAVIVRGAEAVMTAWAPVREFFADLWSGVVGIFDQAVGRIMGIVGKVTGAVRSVIGAASDIGNDVIGFFGGGPGPQVVSPQERTAKTIEERRETSSAELTIRDETGRAELKSTGRTSGASIQLADTGAF